MSPNLSDFSDTSDSEGSFASVPALRPSVLKTNGKSRLKKKCQNVTFRLTRDVSTNTCVPEFDDPLDRARYATQLVFGKELADELDALVIRIKRERKAMKKRVERLERAVADASDVLAEVKSADEKHTSDVKVSRRYESTGRPHVTREQKGTDNCNHQ